MKATMLLIGVSCALAAQAQDPAPYVSNPTPPPSAVSVSTNLLKNGNFESGKVEAGTPPDDWGFIVKSGGPVNGGLIETAAHSGKRSVGIGGSYMPNDKWQVLAFNAPVEAKATYQYSAWVKAYPEDQLFGGTKGTIAIEWKDASGNEISRILGDSWGQSELKSGEWTQFKVSGEAPANVATATFTITYYLNPNAKSGGTFLIDDALAEKASKN